ncbi:hypothetical protein, partial [Salmonella enterica]|uniref:hypothetical protein n=1 Tax=Salmonella enterica TaxID=28901 RepID=UPI0021B38FE6
AYVGIPGKRLIRLLESFEAQKIFVRRAQRIGKHFVYRYYDAGLYQERKTENCDIPSPAVPLVAPTPHLRFDTISDAISSSDPAPSSDQVQC